MIRTRRHEDDVIGTLTTTAEEDKVQEIESVKMRDKKDQYYTVRQASKMTGVSQYSIRQLIEAKKINHIIAGDYTYLSKCEIDKIEPLIKQLKFKDLNGRWRILPKFQTDAPDIFLRELEKGRTLSEASKGCGCCESTIRHWVHKGLTFPKEHPMHQFAISVDSISKKNFQEKMARRSSKEEFPIDHQASLTLKEKHQNKILSALEIRTGAFASVGDLAREVGISIAQASVALTGLEKLGLISRTLTGDGTSRKRISLTYEPSGVTSRKPENQEGNELDVAIHSIIEDLIKASKDLIKLQEGRLLQDKK